MGRTFSEYNMSIWDVSHKRLENGRKFRFIKNNNYRTQQQQNSIGCSQSSPKRESHSVTALSQELRKSQPNSLILHFKDLKNKQSLKWLEGKK